MGTALPRKQATGQASEHQDTSTFDDTSKNKKYVNEKWRLCLWWIWNENTSIYSRHSRNSHQITHTFEIVSVTNCITMTWAQICCTRLLWLILLLTVSWWVALICIPLLIIVGLLQMCFPTLTPAWVMLVGGACFPTICSRQIFSRYYFYYLWAETLFISSNTERYLLFIGVEMKNLWL